MVKGDDEGVCESDCEGGCNKQTDKLMNRHTDIGNCRVTFMINNIFNAVTSQIPPLPHNQKHNYYTGYISIQNCNGSGLEPGIRCDNYVLMFFHPYNYYH